MLNVYRKNVDHDIKKILILYLKNVNQAFEKCLKCVYKKMLTMYSKKILHLKKIVNQAFKKC